MSLACVECVLGLLCKCDGIVEWIRGGKCPKEALVYNYSTRHFWPHQCSSASSTACRNREKEKYRAGFSLLDFLMVTRWTLRHCQGGCVTFKTHFKSIHFYMTHIHLLLSTLLYLLNLYLFCTENDPVMFLKKEKRKKHILCSFSVWYFSVQWEMCHLKPNKSIGCSRGVK